MSALAQILMWSAVLLTAMVTAELKLTRRLIPAGEPTSIKFELAIMVITWLTIAALTILLGDIIGPGGPPPDWAEEFTTPRVTA